MQDPREQFAWDRGVAGGHVGGLVAVGDFGQDVVWFFGWGALAVGLGVVV